MSDPGMTSQADPLVVSDEVQKKFPELVELIKGSRSMGEEERQYWVDVLLIMTEDQIQNLKNILENERKQIAEAEKKFKTGLGEDEHQVKITFDEIKYREKKRLLAEAEKKAETEETANEADLLKQIQNM
jgi:hypothetical protein